MALPPLPCPGAVGPGATCNIKSLAPCRRARNFRGGRKFKLTACVGATNPQGYEIETDDARPTRDAQSPAHAGGAQRRAQSRSFARRRRAGESGRQSRAQGQQARSQSRQEGRAESPAAREGAAGVFEIREGGQATRAAQEGRSRQSQAGEGRQRSQAEAGSAATRRRTDSAGCVGTGPFVTQGAGSFRR